MGNSKWSDYTVARTDDSDETILINLLKTAEERMSEAEMLELLDEIQTKFREKHISFILKEDPIFQQDRPQFCFILYLILGFMNA